jgi:hypothetical protein
MFKFNKKIIAAAMVFGFGLFIVSCWLIGSMVLSICIGVVMMGSSIVLGRISKFKEKGASRDETRI